MRIAKAVSIYLLLLIPLAQAQTTKQTDPEREFATFGVKISTPDNWKRLPEDSPDMIAKWGIAGAGSAPDHYDVVLTAELETAHGKNLKNFVADVAKKDAGECKQETVGLGEEATWRITYPKNTTETVRPHAMLVAIHDEYLYRVTAYAGAAAGDADAALEDLRRGWNFCALVRPSQCVALRDEPVSYVGKVSMKPPAVLRPKALAEEAAGGKALEFQIFNYRSGRADMVMTLEVDKRPAKKSLEDLGQQLLKQMSLKQDPEHPIKWKKLEGDRDAVICNSFGGAKAGNRTVPLRFALVALTTDEVVLLGFVFPTGDKTDQEVYEELTESMAQTVQPVKK
jgi:hypothetical protein